MEFSDLSSLKQDEVGEINRNEQHVYTNVALVHRNISSTEDVNHDYEILQRMKKPSPQQSDVDNGGLIKGLNKRIAAILASAVIVLFVAVTGLAVAIFVPKGNRAVNAVNGEWDTWGQWGQCSATCNTGMEYRNRICSNPSPSNGGNFCFGEPSEYRLCNIANCASGAVNGNWSMWEPWGQCSATCSTGMELRKRTCSNPSPSNGGDFCFGETSEYRLCNKGNCAGAVNGHWSIWEPWGQCSATCGTGMELRKRTCSNPSPSNGGNFCFGEPSEYRLCNKGNCAEVNGGWSSWSSWSSCSASCMKARTRTCTNPAPSQYGRICQGNSEDKDNCDLTACSTSALSIRLVNGTSTQGRVEVSLNGTTWGNVCDDSFTTGSAQVVCRMLGRTGGSFFTSINSGNGSIFLDDVTCTGYESTLLYCKHGGWGKHNCAHSEDVGVTCN